MLDSSGSEAADSEGRLVGVEDRGCSDGSESDVSVAVAATELLAGNSVRLRLAVALADLGLLSVDVVEGVVAFDSVGTTGTTNELDAAAEGNPWLD